MNHRPVLWLVAGVTLLSACGGDAPPEETEAEAERNAKGEVVGGTISDAMIPLDQLRSQSPPLKQTPSQPSATTSQGDEAAPADESEGDPAPEAPPEPEPEPVAEVGED